VPLRDGDSVSGRIGHFTPQRIPAEVWNRVEGVVREAVARKSPPTSGRAQVYLNAVTQLAVWADAVGQSIEPDNLFHPETIERFIHERVGHLSTGTQTNYRSQLRAVAKVVIGSTLYPPTTIVPRSEQRLPYTRSEVSGLVSWSAGLSTESLRRNTLVLLAMGLGAGLTAQEMTRLTGDDVFVDEHGVVVRVIGQSQREIPVLRRWEDHLAAFAREAGPRPVFLPTRTRILGHAISNFLERCSSSHVPGFSVLRLRTTWIVNQMEAGTPLPMLSAIAGVGPTQLARYFELLPASDLGAVRQQIRDAGV
jgi:hypothetical protein